MVIEELELTAVDERRALAAFRIRMLGARSGAETSMRLWNLLTFEGRRILRIEEFSDEDDALAAVHGGSA
jgi:ketosteroid isomerase-like protein